MYVQYFEKKFNEKYIQLCIENLKDNNSVSFIKKVIFIIEKFKLKFMFSHKGSKVTTNISPFEQKCLKQKLVSVQQINNVRM